MCILMGKRLAVFLNSFLLLQFFWLKMQKSTFLVLRVVFIKLTFRWITNWSVRLEKHQTIEILPMVDFLRIFKMLHFSNFFDIFEIHQYFLVKL